MKCFRSQSILYTLLLLAFSAHARDLRVKRKSPTPVLRSPAKATVKTQFSLSLVTPLVIQNLYDARFSTWGTQFFFSIPISLNESNDFRIKLGVGSNFSALSLTTPPINFLHIFINFPVQLHCFFHPSSNFSISIFGGLESKLLEFDSRTTVDGGFRLVDNFFGNLNPDLGTNLELKIGQNTSLIGIISLLYLGGAIAFDL